MSDIVTTTDAAGSRRETAPDITLPNGKTLTPRVRFAAEIGACDKTVARMSFATAYIAGLAYIERESSLQELAGRARRRHVEPAKRRNHRR
jgi:hypothetical protein